MFGTADPILLAVTVMSVLLILRNCKNITNLLASKKSPIGNQKKQ
jgi:hypothetical protein